MRLLAVAALVLMSVGGICPSAHAQVSYSEMDLTDLRLDFKTLRGQRVKVSGLISSGFGTATLSKTLGDLNGVEVNVDDLPREQRKAILDKCQPLCEVTVLGKVSRSVFNELLIEAEGVKVGRFGDALFEDLTD